MFFLKKNIIIYVNVV